MIEDDIQTLKENQKLLVEQTQMYLQKLLPDEVVCIVQRETHYFIVDKENKRYSRMYDIMCPSLERDVNRIIMDDTEENEFALKDSGYKQVRTVAYDCGDWPRQNNVKMVTDYMKDKTPEWGTLSDE